jgi:hypothetical protein
MNIFILDTDAVKAAKQQCDKHIVKMVTESAQMLSTAHRILDGTETIRTSKSGKRMVKYWTLDGEMENIMMKAVHINHPCTLWTMASKENYDWHWEHYKALSDEYTHRYGKQHGAFYNNEIGYILKMTPKNIQSKGLTPFALAMGSNPECIHPGDPVRSYREFYQTKQDRFGMSWKNREVPDWFRIHSNM